jgi:hypothetical protein
MASVCGMPRKREEQEEALDSTFLRNKAENLARTTERNQVELVRSEIMLADTFCDLAETELRVGDHEHAKKVIGNARSALQEAAVRIRKLNFDGDELQEMQAQLNLVAKRLGELEQALQAPGTP